MTYSAEDFRKLADLHAYPDAKDGGPMAVACRMAAKIVSGKTLFKCVQSAAGCDEANCLICKTEARDLRKALTEDRG